VRYPDNMALRPLASWPTPFTEKRRRSPFSSLFTATLSQLDRELRQLGDGGPAPSVLQIALREKDFRVDGMLRANSQPEHPGVILSIESRHGALSYPCDQFDHWQVNLRAITLGLEALRKLDRYGITQTGQQYTGWRAIESAPQLDPVSAACSLIARFAWPNENPDCLGEWANKVATDPTIRRNTIRRARGNAHPDRNEGSQALWDHVVDAVETLRNAGIGGLD